MLDALPDDVVQCIVGFIPLDMLGRLFVFNHRLHRCCMECDGLWQTILHTSYGMHDPVILGRKDWGGCFLFHATQRVPLPVPTATVIIDVPDTMVHVCVRLRTELQVPRAPCIDLLHAACCSCQKPPCFFLLRRCLWKGIPVLLLSHVLPLAFTFYLYFSLWWNWIPK